MLAVQGRYVALGEEYIYMCVTNNSYNNHPFPGKHEAVKCYDECSNLSSSSLYWSGWYTITYNTLPILLCQHIMY